MALEQITIDIDTTLEVISKYKDISVALTAEETRLIKN